MNRCKAIDPRIKLTLLPVVGFVSFFVSDTVLLVPMVCFIAVLFVLSRMYRFAFRCLLIFTVVLLIERGISYLGNPNHIFAVYMILFFVSRMTFIALFGTYITRTTGVSEMIEAINRMKISRSIGIPFSVLLRFAPTMRHEVKALRENMKVRGIVTGRWFMCMHPLTYMEYTLVPLLMRAITISDELAASALIRGLDSKEKRISIVDLKMKLIDGAVLVAGVLTVLAVIIMQRMR
ncbi:MAG: energy-coupling factor transporter transmembrane protein EcfT [Treponema sp.]|nr:energy-coupling factor transporter transmembrane protein EcfT [Treponema sp.]